MHRGAIRKGPKHAPQNMQKQHSPEITTSWMGQRPSRYGKNGPQINPSSRSTMWEQGGGGRKENTTTPYKRMVHTLKKTSVCSKKATTKNTDEKHPPSSLHTIKTKQDQKQTSRLLMCDENETRRRNENNDENQKHAKVKTKEEHQPHMYEVVPASARGGWGTNCHHRTSGKKNASMRNRSTKPLGPKKKRV